jgi:transposase InsO family protein
MPLRARTIVEIREEVVRRVKEGLSISEAAGLYGVSRPTIYEWLRRYAADGVSGLIDRSRAPQSCPHRTAEWIEQQLIAERKRWKFGSKKVLQRLIEAEPGVAWPARSTVDNIFDRAGLVQPRRRRERKRLTPFLRRYVPERAGELSTIDFKGQFRLRNGRLCYPLTFVDSWSRYLIACVALPSTHLEPTWAAMERAFREFGLPDAVQSDNGPPFGAKGFGRLSTISIRLMKLGVLPVFSRPGKPQDNGAHERMHRDLKERAAIPPGRDLRHQQKKLDDFRDLYNNERPHEGIGMYRPAHLYSGSARPFPRRRRAVQYEASFECRRVKRSGMLPWPTGDIFISHAFGGETIGLEPLNATQWNVHFGRFFIGILDTKRKLLI